MVLDSFIKTSATGGLGSIKAEVMADTAVALASGNVKLVSNKVKQSELFYGEPSQLQNTTAYFYANIYIKINATFKNLVVSPGSVGPLSCTF